MFFFLFFFFFDKADFYLFTFLLQNVFQIYIFYHLFHVQVYKASSRSFTLEINWVILLQNRWRHVSDLIKYFCTRDVYFYCFESAVALIEQQSTAWQTQRGGFGQNVSFSQSLFDPDPHIPETIYNKFQQFEKTYISNIR